MCIVNACIPGGYAGDLRIAKVAFREAWIKFKGPAGPEVLAVETPDNARNKGKI